MYLDFYTSLFRWAHYSFCTWGICPCSRRHAVIFNVAAFVGDKISRRDLLSTLCVEAFNEKQFPASHVVSGVPMWTLFPLLLLVQTLRFFIGEWACDIWTVDVSCYGLGLFRRGRNMSLQLPHKFLPCGHDGNLVTHRHFVFPPHKFPRQCTFPNLDTRHDSFVSTSLCEDLGICSRRFLYGEIVTIILGVV